MGRTPWQSSLQILRGKRVLLTGHTGFKGAWMAAVLADFGAELHGLALDAKVPSLYHQLDLHRLFSTTVVADVRDAHTLLSIVARTRPEIIIHLAAQALVSEGWLSPKDTFETNTNGVINVLEAIRSNPSVRAALIITSDKCYKPNTDKKELTEADPLGGKDPYSASKAAAELVVAAYRPLLPGCRLASCRAGNVIGGGDWARDRLIPDCVRALRQGSVAEVRNPQHIRPWQHVLEPIGGYLLVLSRLLDGESEAEEPYNFGPPAESCTTVKEVVETVCSMWGEGATWKITELSNHFIENPTLILSFEKAKNRLGWFPKWNLGTAIQKTIEVYRVWDDIPNVQRLFEEQIREYFSLRGAE